ncbi:MAG TPA: hypothetical protein VG146_10410 [Verrucomicrobiae bacterium]|nr:hypothetical protein [Verrucomicrobiae bacterium]
MPPIVGEVVVEDGMTARQLATVLKRSPYKVVADLMEAGVLATPGYQIPFDLISKVARKYGYLAKRTA